MTIVRLDRNRELSLAHKAPLYVILEVKSRMEVICEHRVVHPE